MFRIGVSFSLILLLFHKRPGEKCFSVVSDERLSSLAILRRHTQAPEVGAIVREFSSLKGDGVTV